METLYQVYILDPAGEANYLLYSGPDKTASEEAMDHAESIGRTVRLNIINFNQV